MNQEEFIVPEDKKFLMEKKKKCNSNNGSMSKPHRSQPKELLMAKAGTIGVTR